jgi:hypothetical protein
MPAIPYLEAFTKHVCLPPPETGKKKKNTLAQAFDAWVPDTHTMKDMAKKE